IISLISKMKLRNLRWYLNFAFVIISNAYKKKNRQNPKELKRIILEKISKGRNSSKNTRFPKE
ncbi:MAG: hypothetical protein ACTSRA_15380, partial [Promethearchaeota archaeon]